MTEAAEKIVECRQIEEEEEIVRYYIFLSMRKMIREKCEIFMLLLLFLLKYSCAWEQIDVASDNISKFVLDLLYVSGRHNIEFSL